MYRLCGVVGSHALISNAGGVQATVTYEAFGKVLTITGEPQLGRFRWTGREFDSETGLQHNRARPYDPFSGRFISQDPRGLSAGDTNLYRYVFNGPTNGTDPSGEILPIIVIGVILIGVGAAAYGYAEWNSFSRNNPDSRWALPDWAQLSQTNERWLRAGGQIAMAAGISIIAAPVGGWFAATLGLSSRAKESNTSATVVLTQTGATLPRC